MVDKSEIKRDSTSNSSSSEMDSERTSSIDLGSSSTVIKVILGIVGVLGLFYSGLIVPAIILAILVLLYIFYGKANGKIAGFVKFAITIGVIGVVLYSVVPIATIWFSSGAADIGVTSISTALSNTPIYKYLYNAYQSITNPKQVLVGNSWDSQVDENTNADLGVKITDFKSQDNYYEPKSPIYMLGSIKAASLEDNSKIKIRCSLADYKGATESLISESNSDEAVLYKDITSTFTTQCNFKEGIEISKELSAKEAKLSVIYNFKTKAYEKIYTLSKAQKNVYLSKNLDPFESINEPNLNSDKSITSVTTAGPMKLAIGFTQSQPLSEGLNYLFGITLKNNAAWSGNLERLNQIIIELPSELELSSSGKCDFVKSGESLTDFTQENKGFKTYQLNSEALKKANIDCVQQKTLTEDECISKYKESNNFICILKVLKAEDQTNYIGSIKAEANYVYSTKQSATVKIVKPDTPLA